MLRIGEFAALSGLSAKALRAYDQRGIFRPAWVDPGTGYRFYSPAQIPELRRIVALKDLGIPLAEVAALVDGGGDLGEALRRRRSELEALQARITEKMAALDIRVEMADEGPDVVVRTVASLLVASLSSRVGPGEDIGPLFYEVESAVRDARARAPLPPGAIVGPENPDGSVEVEVVVPVTHGVASDRVSARVLEGCRAATVIHRGPYAGMHGVRDALGAWVAAAGYEPAGPRRIMFLQFGAEPELEVPEAYLAKRPDEYVTELQIPIRSAAQALLP